MAVLESDQYGYVIVTRLIFWSPTFHKASSNRYTPNQSTITQKLTCCQQFGVPHPPKYEYHFGSFSWGKNLIFPAKRSNFAYQHVIHILKANASPVKKKNLEPNLEHPTRRRVFAKTSGMICKLIFIHTTFQKGFSLKPLSISKKYYQPIYYEDAPVSCVDFVL